MAERNLTDSCFELSCAQGAVASTPQDYPGGGGDDRGTKTRSGSRPSDPGSSHAPYTARGAMQVGKGRPQTLERLPFSSGSRGLSPWCPSCPASPRQTPLCPRSRSPMPRSLCPAMAACSPVLLQACSWEEARRVNVHSPGKGPEVHQSLRFTAHRGVSPKAPRKF